MICYLLRHGKDDETVRGGWSDHPLTEEGLRQAETLAFADWTVSHIYSSDLQRAIQTAQIIAQRAA